MSINVRILITYLVFGFWLAPMVIMKIYSEWIFFLDVFKSVYFWFEWNKKKILLTFVIFFSLLLSKMSVFDIINVKSLTKLFRMLLVLLHRFLHYSFFAMADWTENENTLKYLSLITLTLQNAILGISMRYANTRTSKEDRFFSSTGK